MEQQVAIVRFTDAAGEARYHLKGLNGEIILTSESYHSTSNRNRAVARLKRLLGDAAIVVDA